MLGLLLLMLVLEVVACILVSCTTILDLQNSKESQNSWNCGVKPRTCKAGGGDYRRPQGHEPTKPFEGVSSAPSTTRLYRRAHHPPPMWGPDWLAMLRVRILRKCQKCGAPRNTMECLGMLDLSKSLGPLNMLHSCVILRNCAEGV